MAQAINYAAIAPSSGAAATGEKAAASHFSGAGQRLGNKKSRGAAAATPGGVERASVPRLNGGNGPQPLRLPPGKLFFGYEYVPPRKRGEGPGDGEEEGEQKRKTWFTGQGKNLRGRVVDASALEAGKSEGAEKGGRTLRDAPK